MRMHTTIDRDILARERQRAACAFDPPKFDSQALAADSCALAWWYFN